MPHLQVLLLPPSIWVVALLLLMSGGNLRCKPLATDSSQLEPGSLAITQQATVGANGRNKLLSVFI
jgi:hypothetical protein